MDATRRRRMFLGMVLGLHILSPFKRLLVQKWLAWHGSPTTIWGPLPGGWDWFLLIPGLVITIQPILVAMWAALGCGSLGIRSFQGLFILALLNILPESFASHRAATGAQSDVSLLTYTAPAFVGALGLFWIVRHARKVRIIQTDSSTTAGWPAKAGNFRLRALFELTALAAVTSAVARVTWNRPILEDLFLWQPVYIANLIWGFVGALLFVPAAVLILAPTKQLRWIVAAGLSLLALFGFDFVLCAMFSDPMPVVDRWRLFSTALMMAILVGSFWLIRCAGYRWIRQPSTPLLVE